jgi:cytochrome c
MKRLLVAVIVLLVAGFVCAAERGTKKKAKEMVNEAAAFIEAKGRAAAIAEFTNPKGKFMRGDLYVFAYDLAGTVLAHPMNPRLVGKNLVDVPDADGKLFRKEIVEQAKSKGEGWVDYRYENPDTNKIEAKTTYFKKVGDMIVGCGERIGKEKRAPNRLNVLRAERLSSAFLGFPPAYF